MGQIRTFLNAVKTTIEGITSGSYLAFNRVYIAPLLDLDMILASPRFPMAVIVGGGGTLDRNNGAIWSRTFDVVIIHNVPKDHLGTEASLSIDDLGELLIDDLEYDNYASIHYEADLEGNSFVTKEGVIIVTKVFRFTYALERN